MYDERPFFVLATTECPLSCATDPQTFKGMNPYLAGCEFKKCCKKYKRGKRCKKCPKG
ncbi:hypothetical protein SAMN05421740_10298 [Parapedobacter koreensis]|uniref:Uncharacterized protein n=1 Tax=Parapedobacter koreensis TaxID=332977 RepID=A0A1H7I5B7_9SPHI|nr:hypothetical protein SAMN05421740_10298 [Parapedobacter koreensis]